MYTGASGFERYQSALIGSGLNTQLGAFALDITQSRLKLEDNRQQGQQYRLTWNSTLPRSATALWLEAKYSSHHFYGQRDATDAQAFVSQYFSSREKQSFSASINQPLSDTRGSFYLSGSLKKFWDQQDNYRQYAVGYTNAQGNLTGVYPPSVSGMRINRVRSPKMTKSCSHSAISCPGITPVLRRSSDSYSNNGKASNTRLGFTTSTDEENNIVWGSIPAISAAVVWNGEQTAWCVRLIPR